jgi:hypothetical protein
VAQFYFLREDGSSFDEKLKNRLDSYQFLVAEYERVLSGGLLAPAITAFRKRFGFADSFTDTKVVDTLIWRFAAMLAGGALRTGLVRYS